MKQRTITGIFILLLCAALVSLYHLQGFAPALAALLGIFSVWEILHGFSVKNRTPYVVLCAASIGWAACPLGDQPLVFLPVLIVGLAFFLWLMHCLKVSTQVPTAAAYPAAVLCILLFRAVSTFASVPSGIFYLVFTACLCILTDVLAYLSGRLFGRHKLAPHVSPGKTIEGAVGSILLTIPCAFLLRAVLPGDLFPWNTGITILFMLLLCILSQLGDLSMSAVKRVAGIKDFGKIFPGHGGILDRCDSLLYTLPLTWIFLKLFIR